MPWTAAALAESLIADTGRNHEVLAEAGASVRRVPRFPADAASTVGQPSTVGERPVDKRASKFGNVRTLGPAPWGGEMAFDSAAEAATARDLDLQKRTGAIRGWLPQVSLPIGTKPGGLRRHRVDFLVVEKDGRMRLLERKGHDHADGKQRRNDLAAMGVPVDVASS